jgi:hypothetical protein
VPSRAIYARRVDVFAVQGTIQLVVLFVLLVVKIYAFVSSLTFSAEAYQAAGKLTKPAWCIFLGLGAALQLIRSPLGILSIVFTIAAFVYLADVRPALAQLRRR